MSYQSPLHIIKGIADPDFKINETNLIRLRKQLLADLNLSGGTTISVKEKSYTKDEIIKTFDVLLNDPELDLHEFIFNNKNLLAFLENDELYYTLAGFLKVKAPEELREKFQLMMEPRFILQLKKSISKRNFIYAKESVLFINQLQEERKSINYEEVHRSIVALANFNNEIVITIKNNNNDRSATESIKGEIFSFLGDHKVADFLNALPADFNDVIDQFSSSVTNLMYYYHKQATYDKKLVSRMSHMQMKIRFCDRDHYDLIRRNHKAYSNTRTSTGGTGANSLRVIIFVVIILVKICFWNTPSSNDYSTSQFEMHNYNTMNNNLREMMDSVNTVVTNAKIPADSIEPLNANIGEQMPEFLGLDDYIKKNLVYPEKAKENGTSGLVHLTFVVEKDGTVSHVRAQDSIGDDCEQAAINVVKSMPRWKPGKKDGKRVRTQFNLPVRFTIE
ncbi:MAG: TonB family protein [Bacteroidetes bacterium]|nr:TonB family protein [Bacteroidota bacterium]